MTGATPKKLQAVKKLLLRHGWKLTGQTEGEVIARARAGAPDDGQHMEERRAAGRLQFERGYQSASIGPGSAVFWRWSRERGKHDLVKISTVRVHEIEKLLEERSPLTPEQKVMRERERQSDLVLEQSRRNAEILQRRR